MSQVNRFRGVLHLIQKDIVIELISKIRNRKPAGLSNLVSEMVKAAEEAEVDMITDLVNQIIRQEAIPAEWELSTVVKYYKEKENALEGRNCKGLKWTHTILKVIAKLMRQQVDINEMCLEFGFMPGCRIKNLFCDSCRRNA